MTYPFENSLMMMEQKPTQWDKYSNLNLPSGNDAYSFLQVRSSYATQSSLKVNLSIPPFLPNSFSPMG